MDVPPELVQVSSFNSPSIVGAIPCGRPNPLWSPGSLLLLCCLGGCDLAFANGANFFGNVNSNWAPGNATPTTNASRGAKLIKPACQFMRHPLAIPRLC